MLSMLFNINNQFILISSIIVIILTIRVSRASLGLRLLVIIRRKVTMHTAKGLAFHVG